MAAHKFTGEWSGPVAGAEMLAPIRILLIGAGSIGGQKWRQLTNERPDLLPFKFDQAASERTRKFLSGVVQLCLDYVERENRRDEKVIDFYQPEQILQMFDFSIPDSPTELDQLVEDCRQTLAYQVRTGKFRRPGCEPSRSGAHRGRGKPSGTWARGGSRRPIGSRVEPTNDPHSWRSQRRAQWGGSQPAPDKRLPRPLAAGRVKCAANTRPESPTRLASGG